MLEYDFWRKYPYCMDKGGKALVVSCDINFEWLSTYGFKSPHYLESDVDGTPEYRGDIVSYRSCRIDDDRFLLCFKDPQNYDAIVDNFPNVVLERDPFGPDLCPSCKKSLRAGTSKESNKGTSYWKTLFKAVFNIRSL